MKSTSKLYYSRHRSTLFVYAPVNVSSQPSVNVFWSLFNPATFHFIHYFVHSTHTRSFFFPSLHNLLPFIPDFSCTLNFLLPKQTSNFFFTINISLHPSFSFSFLLLKLCLLSLKTLITLYSLFFHAHQTE